MKSIYTFIFFIFSSAEVLSADVCQLNLQMTDSSNKIYCINKYRIGNSVPQGFNKNITEIARTNRCISVAVSIDNKCDSTGVSNYGDIHCHHPTAREMRNNSALGQCQNSGCKCKLVIDDSRIIDLPLFFAYNIDSNESEKVATISENLSQSKDSDTKKAKDISSQIPEEKKQKPSYIKIVASEPDQLGNVNISVQANRETSSLLINGEELGGRVDGNYTVKKVVRVGQDTRFTFVVIDSKGNSDTKTIIVSRSFLESKITYQQLNPDRIKRQPERDAVAVIIGISNYKSLPKAEFAKDDAQVFYDYAIRALGVKPGNIKLLMDDQADAEEIYTAFKTWLPARVKTTTDVYVFYSGHGLPTQDGSGLFWLPQRANRDLISKTSILLSEVNSDIQASKPKSVTIFMDACYSGQTRGGETLVASARPIALKSQPTTFPNNFTVISASQADQISSSSSELQHGIFSYYLMRGLEGEADLNKDGKISLDEIQAYLSENVSRHARSMNRQQEPQVIGDGNRILVGK